MPKFWDQFGKDYNQVNKNTGGFAEFLNKKLPRMANGGIVAPDPSVSPSPTPDVPYDTRKAIISSFPGIAGVLGVPPDEVEQAKQWRQQNDAMNLAKNEQLLSQNKIMGNAVSATQGLVSGATLGAPEAIQKIMGNTPESGAPLTQQVKEQYPLSNIAGNVAGGVASSLAMPGAGEALAAKGIMAGKGLLPTIGRAAVNTAGFAIPSAITEGIATGDPGKTWQDFKSNMLWGTAGGAAISKVFGAAPKIAASMKDVADDMVLGAAGGNARALKAVAGGGVLGKQGATAEKIAQLKSNVADVISKSNLWGKNAIKDFTHDNGKIWDSVDDAFQTSGVHPSHYLGEVLNDPTIQSVMADPQYGSAVGDYIQNTMGRLDAQVNVSQQTGQKSLPNIRKILMTDIENSKKSLDPQIQLNGIAANSIRDTLDGHFVPSDLKAAWPGMKLLQTIAQREETMIPKAEPGSATAPRMLLSSLIHQGEGGAILGAASGAQDFDPTDPTTYGPLLLRMGLGTVGGALLNRAMAKGANQISGRMAGGLRNLISGGVAQAPNIQALGQALGPAVSQFAGSGALQRTGESNQPVTSAPETAPGLPSTAPQVPAVPVSGQMAGADTLGMEATQQLPEPAKVAPEHQEAVQQATQKETELTPQQVSDSKIAAFAPFADKVTQALHDKWDAWQNPYKMDWDSFLEDAKQKSGNFDPKNPMTAKFIAGDDYKRYLKSYNVALNMQDIGKDLSDAMSPFKSTFLNPAAAEKRDLLVKTLYTAMTGDMKDPDKATKKNIEGTLNRISYTGGNQKQKLEQLLSDQYGVNFDQLRSYGLYK